MTKAKCPKIELNRDTLLFATHILLTYAKVYAVWMVYYKCKWVSWDILLVTQIQWILF